MKLLLISLFAFLFTTGIYAQQTKYCSKEGIAIKGYDPVAYFLQHEALEGNENFSTAWSGSKWKFISQANLDSFKLAPQKYAPQYGGYCAYGLSENHKAPTDPQAWTIVDNKLYLNYNPKVKEMWLKDTTAKIKAADNNWPVLNQ
ncbi:YHS domain-containing (seleno)protein [Ferruginibacter sp.]